MVRNINDIKLDIIGLYTGNYLSEFHIRKMAKLIGKSHVSLLPHLRKFEKDKILVVKNIGRSRVYSLNMENNQVREFLSLSEKKRTIEFLNKEFLIKKLYNEFINLQGCLILFGSYASETRAKESDIDLFYIGDIKKNEKSNIKEFGRMYNRKVHLINMTIKQFKEQLFKQNPLIKEVVKSHIILYNHDIFINEVWKYYHGRREW